MLISIGYRGYRLARHFDPEVRDHTNMWTVNDAKELRQWNEALAYVDSVATEPKPPTIACGFCGEIELSMGADKALIAKQLCFSCDFWHGVLNTLETIVIGQDAYVIMKEDGASSFRGYNGRKFVIRMSGGQEITTTNLWHRGTLPEHFVQMSHACRRGSFVTNQQKE